MVGYWVIVGYWIRLFYSLKEYLAHVQVEVGGGAVGSVAEALGNSEESLLDAMIYPI